MNNKYATTLGRIILALWLLSLWIFPVSYITINGLLQIISVKIFITGIFLAIYAFFTYDIETK